MIQAIVICLTGHIDQNLREAFFLHPQADQYHLYPILSPRRNSFELLMCFSTLKHVNKTVMKYPEADIQRTILACSCSSPGIVQGRDTAFAKAKVCILNLADETRIP